MELRGRVTGLGWGGEEGVAAVMGSGVGWDKAGGSVEAGGWSDSASVPVNDGGTGEETGDVAATGFVTTAGALTPLGATLV